MRLTKTEAKAMGIRLQSESKMRNKKTMMCGILFDSKKEAEYYLALLDGKRRGLIRDIELQPEFELQPKFRHDNKTERAIKYIADFRVTYADGSVEIIDVKGKRTDLYAVKRKLFLYKYPEIVFKEV